MRASDGVPRIGPNAVLQLIPVLDRALGTAGREALFREASVEVPSADAGMLPETAVHRLHHTLRVHLPDQAPGLAREAGLATGDYILANRIPIAAQTLIRALPGWAAARLLSAAILRNAWTFVGSGRFAVASHRPLTFEITGNPMIAGDQAARPICHWHSAVFERLFARLVWPQVSVTETHCAACGDGACRFVLRDRG